ncbi:MAG: hypothetical protein R3281_03000 [Balneolaceae bacterium]|nr:hypothetical protein [Balneolaceae bacterium]
MKIQARAEITSYSLDGKDVNMEGNRTRTIELEFSAVDTGGAFRDIILDFSFRITGRELENDREFGQPCKLSVTMRNPDIP